MCSQSVVIYSTPIYRDSAEYMEATKVLKEVEADVKEKFAAAQKERGIEIPDTYQGITQAERIELKAIRDALRKAIVSMDGDELDTALEDCYAIEGFEDNESNAILLRWAEKVRTWRCERNSTREHMRM